MSESNAAILRGTSKGLEIHVTAGAELEAICTAITTRIAEAPAFFRGSDVRIRVEDALPKGGLRRLDEIAEEYDLRIVEIGAAKRKLEAIPHAQLAAGSAPATFDDADEITTQGPPPTPSRASEAALDTAAPELAAIAAVIEGRVVAVDDTITVESLREATPTPEPIEGREPTSRIALAQALPLLGEEKTKVVVGPIRSGVILSHPGHIVIFGDVNPGAEVRAEGNIIVLGRLRGTAHAGIGGEAAFILALRLEPQQLRIARQVARSGDDAAGSECEIAHVVGDAITVERYLGKLPRNLAASL